MASSSSSVPPFLKRSSWVVPEQQQQQHDDERRHRHGSMNMRGSVLGTTFRRDLLAQQAELDRAIFDSSLGCPLASFDNATLALVGGKALQCWRLTKHGFPVPSAFVLPTYVYSLHVRAAGVHDLIQEVFSSQQQQSSDTDLRSDQEGRAATMQKLDTIRTKILETPLDEQVIENLKAFIDSLQPGTPVAVRSSGTAEDLANQSFAGQYDTFLYQTKLQDICDSIKACWASMFQTHILDYASSSSSRTEGEQCVTTTAPPTMGVLIMRMVEAKASGVMFTQNLWGDKKKQVMIEAVLGQGEGLVSGQLTPDRYVLDKYTLRVAYQELQDQTQKFVRSRVDDNTTTNGVQKISLEQPHQGPVLSEKELKQLGVLARSIESFYNTPQDIEWAVDEQTGSIYILQSRPITTGVGGTSSNKMSQQLAFLCPGEGYWTSDPVHFPRPMSPWFQENYSIDYTMERSRRAGCLIKTIDMRFIHGFVFTQPVFFPPDTFGKLEAAGHAYWSKKLYEDDYREFCDWFRPECEQLQQELKIVNPASLSHAALVDHVEKCFDYAAEFWKRHHTFTIPSFCIVGDYQNAMSKLTGKSPMECLVLLESASPESRGILNHQDPLLSNMYSLFRRSPEAKNLLQCCDNKSSASWAMDCLMHMPGEMGEVMRQVVLEYGFRLAGGYDIVNPSLIESPDFFLKTILQGVEDEEDIAEQGEKKVMELAKEWRSALPADKHSEFDEILDVGRRFFRIRDERGLATDLSGVGLCRRGILEAGRRLADSGVINQAEHLTVAVKREALALLTGDLGTLRSSAGRQGPIEIPTAKVLEDRFNHIKHTDPKGVPRALGTPPPPPPQLPDSLSSIGRTMAAMETGLLSGIWDEGAQDDEAIIASDDKVKGLTASAGTITGPVCLVLDDTDLQNVRKGDIIVTYSSSASFNIVLGLCSGICTDYGGMLSHAAIVAREYGVPAVVGTQDATKKFRNGDIVCIDSSTCAVTRV